MLREGQIRIPSGCAIAAIIDRKGNKINGSEIIKSIALMHDRSNGLGGGFAAYGIYPEHKDEYAIHVFYDNAQAKKSCEEFLFKHFNIDVAEKIPTRQVPSIENGPDIWRYFGKANRVRMKSARLDELEYVAQCVTKVNNSVDGAYIFSSGKKIFLIYKPACLCPLSLKTFVSFNAADKLLFSGVPYAPLENIHFVIKSILCKEALIIIIKNEHMIVIIIIQPTTPLVT